MAGFRLSYTLALIMLLCAVVMPAWAEGAGSDDVAGLYESPMLVVDPGSHTAMISSADVDREGRWAVTGSHDGTMRVWSLTNGRLLQTIRIPAGPEDIGEIYAVAMSPDGTLVAASSYAGPEDRTRIYMFERESGRVAHVIRGLKEVVQCLAFSPDGRLLAATYGEGFGVRTYARDHDWHEAGLDWGTGGNSFGIAFTADGARLATSSYDGEVRLYAREPNGQIRRIGDSFRRGSPDGLSLDGRPSGLSFSPDGSRLAVGFDREVGVALLDGRTLKTLQMLPEPEHDQDSGGGLTKVAWSRDGAILFAGGDYGPIGGSPVLAWSGAGLKIRRILKAGRSNVMSLATLPDGDLLVASADPWLGRLTPTGDVRWANPSPEADFRLQYDNLAVSRDGTTVDFGFAASGAEPARFDVATRTLTLNPPADSRTERPRREGAPVKNWLNSFSPTLAGRKLPHDPGEMSTSVAVNPSVDRFVLGSSWGLRALRTDGRLIWQHMASSAVWAVNITNDGRLVVAAYADGTIRWHRMSDGVELLAFMPLAPASRRDWVAWTPEGFYAASPGARDVLRWHVNHGWDEAAESMPLEALPDTNWPEALPVVLERLDGVRALGLAEVRREVALTTESHAPSEAKLYLLAIGINAYERDSTNQLNLRYAEQDATSLASAILNTQGRLYAQVLEQVLLNGDADRQGIKKALDAMAARMVQGTGNDLAVIHFSGHGATVGGKLYLLPSDVEPTDFGIEDGALSLDYMREKLTEIAKHGRVLLLLDACHSGAFEINGTALRNGLAGANVTVLTSSSGDQVSREDPAWQHGAFTKVLLDALKDPEADVNHDGLITTYGLAHFVAQHVPKLTDGAQIPGMEVRYDAAVFAMTH